MSPMKSSDSVRERPSSSRWTCFASIAALLLAFVATASTPVRSDALKITVRDAETGGFVDAEVELTGADSSRSLLKIHGGRAQWQVEGELNLELTASGYTSLSTQLAADTHDVLLWLDPVPAPTAAGSTAGTGVTIVGHVYDFLRGAAVSGARVNIDNEIAYTDSRGQFSLNLPAVDDDEGATAQMSVTADGLPPWSQALTLTNGVSHRIIDLGAGTPGPDHRFDSRQLASPIEDPAAARAPVFPVPQSIRVGFADAGFTTPCCVGSCSAVSVMSLETYVKRGLNDEWIASWTGDRLRAGAIAYRSYGAWHVANPRAPSYDICSSACCQVNDSDTSVSSDAAVNATAGILLSQNGQIFRSEYSAENNAWDDPGDGLPCSNPDLSCGNGFVGSPATGWPCLADSVALGRGCFGHGRGMSQWGSQRWSLDQGQRWPWIVNHYYNANGNGAGLRNSELTSPLRIDQFTAPVNASPGQLITLTLELSNLAALAHDPVYIGASLFRSGSGFVSDPARDLGVRLEPGSQQRSRQFQLPEGLSPGVWDVLVALYLDIDGNGAINSGDLALTSARQNGVLTIVGGPLFADGFE